VRKVSRRARKKKGHFEARWQLLVLSTVAHICKHNKQFLKHNTIFLKHKSILWNTTQNYRNSNFGLPDLQSVVIMCTASTSIVIAAVDIMIDANAATSNITEKKT